MNTIATSQEFHMNAEEWKRDLQKKFYVKQSFNRDSYS